MHPMSRALPALAALALCLAAQDAEGIHWHSNYQEALKEAKATGKPIFLEYRCEP